MSADQHTTLQDYSVIAEAEERLRAARLAWARAYESWKQDPSRPNEARVISASNVYKRAETDLASAHTIFKHNHPLAARARAQAAA